MIVKQRLIPDELIQLEVLLERLPDNHLKKEVVLDEFARRMAGYKGETSLTYPLSFLSTQDFIILHDLRLFDGTHHFQIDTIILTAKFILIIEAKNISGVLYFDTEFNQLIRRNDSGEESFPDPLLQVKRHKVQLKKWLARYHLSHLPIESLVVISNPRTIIQSSSDSVHKRVIHSAQLPFQIETLQQKYNREHLQKEDAMQLANHFIENNYPREVDLLKKYGINYEELIKGVKCPQCTYFACERVYGKWVCRNCGAESKDAHVAALRDYAVLIGNEVKNGQVQEFLSLESRSTVNKLLSKLNLPSKGQRRWKVYSLECLKNQRD